jgi:hypothetical protein
VPIGGLTGTFTFVLFGWLNALMRHTQHSIRPDRAARACFHLVLAVVSRLPTVAYQLPGTFQNPNACQSLLELEIVWTPV